MKYVAFLDVLGFKKRLSKLSQYGSERFISSLSSLLYKVWEEKGFQDSKEISGYIVSDSIIVYTLNDTPHALINLIDYIIEVCKRAFREESILFRCGVAKGSFNHLQSHSFDNLRKGLIVGQAYVDAYLLEDQAKVSAIILDKTTAEDVNEHTAFPMDQIKCKDGEEHSIIKWGDVDFLLQDDNLKKFVKLAKEANWIPHYYNTLYFFLSKGNNEKKQKQVFDNIIEIIKSGNSGQHYREVNAFIENAFSSDIERHFKDMLLKYIRGKI